MSFLTILWRPLLAALAGLVVAGAPASAQFFRQPPNRGDKSMFIRFGLPAEDHATEGLPLGNGRLGAIVSGGTHEERISLNLDTLWSGGPGADGGPGAPGAVAEVRRLLAEGKFAEADAASTAMAGPRPHLPVPLGDLRLTFDHGGDLLRYERSLNLTNGLLTVRYQLGDVGYERLMVVSKPDQVMVVELSSSLNTKLDFTARFDSPLNHEVSAGDGGGVEIVLAGRAPERAGPGGAAADAPEGGGGDGGMRFVARLRVALPDGDPGTVAVEGGTLRVSGAQRATLILGAATGFTGYRRSPGGGEERLLKETSKRVAAAAGRPEGQLLFRSMNAHNQAYRRVFFDLGGTEKSLLDTGERLVQLGGVDPEPDPNLDALLFQYARSLLISSSQPGTQPAHGQGIWNDRLPPPPSAGWSLDGGVQMTYWVAGPGNLKDCHLPLVDLVRDLSITGRQTAEKTYGAGGWTAHQVSDLWRRSTPGAAPPGDPGRPAWPMAAAWLALHLWDHYDFGGDRAFLQSSAYPLLKGASTFYLDFLQEAEPGGALVAVPSASPGGRHPSGSVLGLSSTVDIALVAELFARTVEASERLRTDTHLRSRLTGALAKLPAFSAGADGRLRAWSGLDDEGAPRGVAHLLGLFPGSRISPLKTPELAAAARASLEALDAEAADPFAKAWAVGLWARLHDGERAYQALCNLRGHLGYNLATGPSFDIVPTLGAAAGMAEMVLQSHGDEIHLLPALPAAWPEGRVRGLRARGGFEVDLAWRQGELVDAHVRAVSTGRVKVRYRDAVREVNVRAGRSTPVVFK